MNRFLDPQRAATELRRAKLPFVTTLLDEGTLYGTLAGVRTSLIDYPYPLLRRAMKAMPFACSLASPLDLAAMKLLAISQRGAKRDFVDLYALGTSGITPLAMLDAYRARYQVEDTTHLINSLVYFDDADRESMPRMFWKVNWREIKKTIRSWVKAAAG